MRHLSSLHSRVKPVHLGRVKQAVYKVKGCGMLASYGKRLSPEEYAQKVESSDRLGAVIGEGLRHKKFKPLKFKF